MTAAVAGSAGARADLPVGCDTQAFRPGPICGCGHRPVLYRAPGAHHPPGLLVVSAVTSVLWPLTHRQRFILAYGTSPAIPSSWVRQMGRSGRLRLSSKVPFTCASSAPTSRRNIGRAKWHGMTISNMSDKTDSFRVPFPTQFLPFPTKTRMTLARAPVQPLPCGAGRRREGHKPTTSCGQNEWRKLLYYS